MEFLKDILKLQHNKIIVQVSDIILSDEFEKQEFNKKYNKQNYCLVKVCNYKMHYKSCVKKDDLIYKLDCDYNPSLSR